MSDLFNEYSARLPSSYRRFIELQDGWEGDLGDELGYLRLWSRTAIQENYDGYEMSECLSDRWFPIGTNGGGEILCLDLSDGDDQVYWIPFLGMSDEDALLRYDSFIDIAAAIQKKLGARWESGS
jgi:hypothetical protein